MAAEVVDFGAVFGRLAEAGSSEETTATGGIAVRLVRVAPGGEGTWGSHADTTETVVVWSGDFTVELRDHIFHLSAGQCCVIPVGADHRAHSKAGAEIVLFQRTH